MPLGCVTSKVVDLELDREYRQLLSDTGIGEKGNRRKQEEKLYTEKSATSAFSHSIPETLLRETQQLSYIGTLFYKT